jgi:rhodanese-related sulfurtransferase
MPAVTQVLAGTAQTKAATGSALLVCAHDDEARCQRNHLQGSISYTELRGRLTSLDRDQEIIFYCDSRNQEVSARLAKEFQQQGYSKAMYLVGGVDAWKSGGYPMEGA